MHLEYIHHRLLHYFLSLTTDFGKRRQTGCDLHLHVDAAGLDPLESDGGNPLDHAAPLLRQKVAEGGGNGKNIKGTPAASGRARRVEPTIFCNEAQNSETVPASAA